MKHIYTLFIGLFLITLTASAQSYDFGIVDNGGYNFSVVAIPDFAASDTDVSDVGFTLMLPAGAFDVTNETTFNGRTWDINATITAALLDGAGLGNTRDAFVFNLPPGNATVTHNASEPIVLVSFDVSNAPTTGLMELLPNNDAIAIALAGGADSFYNSNIDTTTTQDYFGTLAAGQEAFSFATLSMNDLSFNTVAFKAFPNPSQDIVNVNNPTSNEYQYTVKNILGQDMEINGTLNPNGITKLSLGKLQKAIYFISVSNGSSTKSLKIIIQ